MTRLALHWQILIAMVAGAALGLGLNFSVGARQLDEPLPTTRRVIQLLGMDRGVVVEKGRFWSLDSPEQIALQVDRLVDEPAGPVRFESRRAIVGQNAQLGIQAQQPIPWPDAPQIDGREIPVLTAPTLGELQKKDPAAYALFQEYGRSSARTVGDAARLLGDLFLRMLKMVSVPLIIASLLSGVTGLGQAERLGKMFGRTLLYYVTTSLLAISVGLLMVNLIRPGVGQGVVAAPAAEGPQHAGKTLPAVLFEQLQNMIPVNPFEAIAEGQFLSIIAFTLMFGICTVLVGGRVAEQISQLVDAAFHVMMKLTMIIIHLAPVGVFFLILAVTASEGIAIFGTLGWYMLAVACALAIHAVVVLPLILSLVARRNPLEYAEAMSPALLTAFSSASSNGTLPLTLTCVEQRAGVSNRVGSFVLPLGATINMDGTALYEVVAVLFIAQFSGQDLSLAQQVVVAFTALLASIGAAGIPHAGLVMMVIILQAVGLPTESQGLIIAVDRVLDMCRTAVNVWSDSCGCAVVARFETGPAPGDELEPPVEGELAI